MNTHCFGGTCVSVCMGTRWLCWQCHHNSLHYSVLVPLLPNHTHTCMVWEEGVGMSSRCASSPFSLRVLECVRCKNLPNLKQSSHSLESSLYSVHLCMYVRTYGHVCVYVHVYIRTYMHLRVDYQWDGLRHGCCVCVCASIFIRS